MRSACLSRKTRETDITLTLNLDGTGKTDIDTGIGFFDHMLTALAVHAGFDLLVCCKGDLNVDCHHTIEDVGIVLGKAFGEAVGDKVGIARYGSFMLPMDEALALCAVDIGGRAFIVCDVPFQSDMIGAFDTQMLPEFFRAFAMNAALTLHVKLLYGENDHHKAEAVFKAVGHALKAAASQNGGAVLSTKGCL